MNEHNRAAKGWSNVTKNEWRHARRALIASVRAWANSGCSATEAEKSSKRAKLALASIRGRTITTTCEACGKKLIAVEEEAVPATFCRECGGGCTALPPEEVLPDLQDGPRGVCRLPHRAEGQQ